MRYVFIDIDAAANVGVHKTDSVEAKRMYVHQLETKRELKIEDMTLQWTKRMCIT